MRYPREGRERVDGGSGEGGLITDDEWRQRDRDDNDDGDGPRGDRPPTIASEEPSLPARVWRGTEGRTGGGQKPQSSRGSSIAVRRGMIGGWSHARRPRARAYG